MEIDHQEKREDEDEDDVAVGYDTYSLDHPEAATAPAAMRLTATSATSATSATTATTATTAATTSVNASGEGNNHNQVPDNAKRSQEMTETDAAKVSPLQLESKKRKVASLVVSTKDLLFPSLTNFVDLWNEGPLEKGVLESEHSLFGTTRSWFIRKSYITVLRNMLQDTDHKIRILHGTAGIGKSSFLLFVLAWIRTGGEKSVLLYFHRMANETAALVLFPVDGQPEKIRSNDPQYMKTFDSWYEQINKQAGYFLVDGMVTFNGEPNHTNVNYIVAKSPSCHIGWMQKSRKRDHWLTTWTEPELLSYASQVEITEDVVKENMWYLGGIVRYAFLAGDAEYAANEAIDIAGPEELFKLVQTGLHSKFDNLKIVDRLIHRIPPESRIGFSSKFKFASEYVATKISMALAISTNLETKTLLHLFKSVGAAGGMRGVLFEAYAARQMAAGGNFPIKPLSVGNTKDMREESMLQLDETIILQKDTKKLNKTTHPPRELQGRLVWPNPDFNLPAIDMFMLPLGRTIIAFQMTVSTTHTLEISGCRAFLQYFDSVCRELQNINPEATVYELFFVVPADIYDKFAKTAQPVTGKNGVVLISGEANDISARISQWVMKVE